MAGEGGTRKRDTLHETGATPEGRSCSCLPQTAGEYVMPSVAFATYGKAPRLTDDDRLVADMIQACKVVAAALRKLPPV